MIAQGVLNNPKAKRCLNEVFMPFILPLIAPS